MKPSDVKVGMTVTVKHAISARNRSNGHKIMLQPGDVAVVDTIDIPKVRIIRGVGKDGRDIFVSLRFESGYVTYYAAANCCNLINATDFHVACDSCGFEAAGPGSVTARSAASHEESHPGHICHTV